MQPVLQAIACDLVVPIGGHRDHGCICFAEYRAIVGESGESERLRAREIGVDGSDKLHAGKARQLLRVVAPHVARADDRRSQ
jgi:hypothetical protein